MSTAQDVTETETDLVFRCLALLKHRGVFAWRQNQGAMKKRDDHGVRTIRFTSINGVSDIIGVLPDGRFLAVECKRPGNVPSEDQQDFLDAVRRRGGIALVIYDVEDLANIVDREMRRGAA